MEWLCELIGGKEDGDNVVGDVFVWEEDWENGGESYEDEVMIVNGKRKKKEELWWD